MGDLLAALSDRLAWHAERGRTQPPGAASALLRADLAEITRVARNTPTSQRPALLSLGARYAEFLGWMRLDAGDDQGALHWTNHAADLAQAAGWRHMVAYTYVRKSLILQQTEPTHAAELAKIARGRMWSPPQNLVALAAAHEAEAYASIGDRTGAQRALEVTERAAGRIGPEEATLGSRSMTPTRLLHVHTTRCDLRLDDPERALHHFTAVMPHLTGPRWQVIIRAPMAVAQAQLGDVEAACRIAIDATADSRQCESASARRWLHTLRQGLQPWAGRTDVDEVLAALPA